MGVTKDGSEKQWLNSGTEVGSGEGTVADGQLLSGYLVLLGLPGQRLHHGQWLGTPLPGAEDSSPAGRTGGVCG